MGRVSAAILVLAACLVAQETEYKIRTDVRLVRLLTTVKDPAGNLVGDLKKTDFRIFDNNIPQEVSIFERTTAQPLSVSLLVDTSSSTGTHLKNEIDSVQTFIRALFKDGNADDRASLYSFSWRVTLERTFTRDAPRLESALRNDMDIPFTGSWRLRWCG